MCVAAIAWNAHPRWRLVAIGNRDEYHEREAAPLARWEDEPGVIGGRDLRAGGTWMGASDAGRFALVTNYRVPEGPQPGRPSRGGLVTDWLARGIDPAPVAAASAFNPFNLLIADHRAARFVSNHPQHVSQVLTDGVHGLSNGGREPPWPKTRVLVRALADWLAGPAEDVAPLFEALCRDEPLPGEGPVPHLSPVFIADPVYGTRCSTVLTIDHDGEALVVERRFTPQALPGGETRLAFRWPDHEGNSHAPD